VQVGSPVSVLFKQLSAPQWCVEFESGTASTGVLRSSSVRCIRAVGCCVTVPQSRVPGFVASGVVASAFIAPFVDQPIVALRSCPKSTLTPVMGSMRKAALAVKSARIAERLADLVMARARRQSS
jgi:hypothetical protein